MRVKAPSLHIVSEDNDGRMFRLYAQNGKCRAVYRKWMFITLQDDDYEWLKQNVS
jgi:hypothetical protein